jgi:CMP-N-acetylneuraminic acid synthetase
MKIIAMIPARLGSQRLKQKNLQLINGIPLILNAINKAKNSNIFNEIWVNSESLIFKKFADDLGVNFHKRPSELADNNATSEDFIYEFLKKHSCDYVIQLHSIAPLITKSEIINFVKKVKSNESDVLLSVEEIQIESAYNNIPVNFSYTKKTNSQDLKPIQKISWAITSWNRKNYLKAYENGKCATYYGKVDYFSLSKMSSHIIKTKFDLDIANALFNLTNG